MTTFFGRAAAARRAARLAVLAGALPIAAAVSPSAYAQASSNCADIQKMLLDRKSIASKLTPGKGGKIDATFACTNFGKLVANGTTLIKWVDANKDWCQIPDAFAEGIKQDNTRAVAIRAKACDVAAKQAKMEKQARENGGGGGGGLLGGPGLEGASKVPQGAL